MFQDVSIAGHTGKIQSFMDLNAWRNGHQFVVELYKATASFPKEEQFGLTNQIRRAAVSLTSNIAEGFSRNSKKEKIQFYAIALGSLTEIQNQIRIATDVGYLAKEIFQKLNEIAVIENKLLSGLLKSTRSKF